jgi:hypothetical protein
LRGKTDIISIGASVQKLATKRITTGRKQHNGLLLSGGLIAEKGCEKPAIQEILVFRTVSIFI